MKRSQTVLAGFLLGVVTLSLQVLLIVADSTHGSREVAASPLLQAATNPKLIRVAFVLKPNPQVILPLPISNATLQEQPASAPTPSPVPLTASLLNPTSIPAVINQPDIHPEDQQLIARVLNLLPPDCLAKLDNFYVVYNHSLTSRGFAGKGVVMIDGTLPKSELQKILLHEALGHFQGLTCLAGTSGSAPSAFKDGNTPIPADAPLVSFLQISWSTNKVWKVGTTNADFVTGYAATDEEEEFADTVAMYLSQPDAFEEMAKHNVAIAQKLSWMQTYLPEQTPVLQGTYVADGDNRPWDATKLPAKEDMVVMN